MVVVTDKNDILLAYINGNEVVEKQGAKLIVGNEDCFQFEDMGDGNVKVTIIEPEPVVPTETERIIELLERIDNQLITLAANNGISHLAFNPVINEDRNKRGIYCCYNCDHDKNRN